MKQAYGASRPMFWTALALLLVNCASALYILVAYRATLDDAGRINDAGRLRGSLQRTAKLALAGLDTAPAVRIVEE